MKALKPLSFFILLLFTLSGYHSFSQSFKLNRTFIIKHQGPNESKEYTVPKGKVWVVNLDCNLCYIRITNKTIYMNNTGIQFDTSEDGDNIPWAFLPITLPEDSKFVIYMNSDLSTNCKVKEYLVIK